VLPGDTVDVTSSGPCCTVEKQIAAMCHNTFPHTAKVVKETGTPMEVRPARYWEEHVIGSSRSDPLDPRYAVVPSYASWIAVPPFFCVKWRLLENPAAGNPSLSK